MRYLILFCFLTVGFISPLTSSPSAHLTEYPSRLSKKPLTKIGGYSLIKLLGEGDQARVYLAQDANQKKYALKVFYTPSEMSEVHPERKSTIETFFESNGSSKAAELEFAAGRHFRHLNIMKLYHKKKIYTESNELVTFLVLEFVPGKHLNKIKSSTLDKKTTLNLATQFINALSHGFSKGFIHADLWDENFLIDQDNNLKIIDLGSFSRLGKKSMGKYKKFFTPMRAMLKRILLMGDFTSSEREQLLSLIDKTAAESENCSITFESASKLQANLYSIEILLQKGLYS